MKTTLLISILTASLLLCNSCGFKELKKDLAEQKARLAYLEGEILSDTQEEKAIIVVIFDSNSAQLYNQWIMYTPTSFRFIVEAPGTYDLVAFEDKNGDSAYQYGEPAGICRQLTGYLVQPDDQTLKNLGITLDPKTRLPEHIDINSALSSTKVVIGEIEVSLGEEVSIDDPRFTEENALLGLWTPLRFLKEVGSGIYFLDPFDPEKTPVIFIHGANGYPKTWALLAGSIDTEKYQRWVCFYPSGLHLPLISQALSKRLIDLKQKYDFSELVIVAHSMGGLVSKGAINHLVEQKNPIQIPLFVTLSTPWEGQEAAEMGVKHAPEYIRSWEDVAPKSPFIKGLWKTPLPDETSHVLFFSYSGKKVAFTDRNNDGAVTLSSQLPLELQKNAIMIRGFNASHTGILSDPQVLECFKSLTDEMSF